MRDEIFELSGTGLGLPARLLHRVEMIDAIVPVPGTSAPLVGIAEAGGRIITLLDPAFWCPDASAPQQDNRPGRYVVTLEEPFAGVGLLLGNEAGLERRSGWKGPTLDESRLAEVLVSRPHPCP